MDFPRAKDRLAKINCAQVCNSFIYPLPNALLRKIEIPLKMLLDAAKAFLAILMLKIVLYNNYNVHFM